MHFCQFTILIAMIMTALLASPGLDAGLTSANMRVLALLLATAAPLAAFQLPTSHRGTHVSHRATCIVSAQASPADGTAVDSTGQMASIIAKRLTEKLDAEWGEHEDHARVSYEP